MTANLDALRKALADAERECRAAAADVASARASWSDCRVIDIGHAEERRDAANTAYELAWWELAKLEELAVNE